MTKLKNVNELKTTKMTKTNPYQVIIDLKLEGDYIQQDSVIDLMKEFAKREIETLKKVNVTLGNVSKCNDCGCTMRLECDVCLENEINN